MKRLLVIGGGGAGMFSAIVATQLKPRKYEATIFSDEKEIYCRCTTPHIITRRASLKGAIQPDSMIEDYGVRLIHEKIISIDPKRRTITSDKNKEYRYDKLVISSGARAADPPIKGLDDNKVFKVRTSKDTDNILKQVKKNKKAVVVGGGVIGIEMASALKERGVKVEVVEFQDDVLSSMVDKEFTQNILSLLKDNNINVKLGSSVKEIKTRKDGRKEVIVNTKEGIKKIIVDFVVVATGIRPNTEFLKDSGITMDRGYIIVNNRMKTNKKHIYACGDCTVSANTITKKKTPSPLASVAIQQAKIVGFQLAGYPLNYKGHTDTYGFEILGKEFSQTGLSEEKARKMFKRVTVGRAKTTNIYKDMFKAEELEVKLIFAGIKRRLVGAEAYGRGTASPIRIASFAISHGMNILKLLRYNYPSHPSLSAWPFMDPIIMATEDALGSIIKK